MTTDDSAKKCASTCWYISVAVGLLLAIALLVGADWSLLWALLFGVVAFLIFGFVLPQLVCTKPIPRPLASATPEGSLVAGDPPAPAPGGDHALAASAAAATPPYFEDEREKDAAPQAHPITSEARKPKTAPDADGAQGADTGSAAKSAPKAKPMGETTTMGAKTAAESSEGKKPETLSAPRGGKADDLKMIKGVGPKLEIMLHGMGFYHYDQIANWSEEEIAWVDQNLQGFKGRATRDDWKGQAKTLASGGTTEFSSRASKGDLH
ncbi:endonuclease [Roseovarius nanhaiticus]|uniref:endonuclease n=1 Tax=Roseovarius nanhaiticus TaxID=573024 RepID=UPI0031F11D76